MPIVTGEFVVHTHPVSALIVPCSTKVNAPGISPLGEPLSKSVVRVNTKTELTLPKSIVRHPIKLTIDHIDLVIVRRGEKVTVSVPVHTSGEHDRDGILEHVNHTIEVETEATSIPSFFELDLTGLAAGLSLYAGDVKLPAGVELISDPKMIVVHLSERSTAVEEVAVVAPAADAAAAAPAADAEKKDA